MYKNITLVAFISAFVLTACGGGSTVPTTPPAGTASSSKTIVSSSKASSISSSTVVSSSVIASSVPSSISSVSAIKETFSSSVVSSSTVVVPSSVASSSVVAPVSSSVASSSVKSSSSRVASSSSSLAKSSSSVAVSSSSEEESSSSSSVSSGPASIYHVRGTHNNWVEGLLMNPAGTSNSFQICINFTSDAENSFKIDPNGAWGNDSFPAQNYIVSKGWVKILFNSSSNTITTQQNLAANCPGASSSSSSVVSSSVKSSSSSSVVSSSVKSSSSSSVAPSSSSSSAASSAGPHHPGEDCKTCHVAGGEASSKIFTVSGTVYKEDGTVFVGASVVLMDTQRLTEVLKLVTDSSGNFSTTASLGSLALSDLRPHVTSTITKRMSSFPTADSCNSCHNPNSTLPDSPNAYIWAR